MALTTPRGQPSDTPVEPFQGASAPNSIGYRFIDLDPASNIYIQRDDQLVIQFMSSIAGEVVNVGVRMLLPGRTPGRTQPDAATVDNKLGDSPYGVIVPIQQSFKQNTARTLTTNVVQLTEGYLLSLVVSSTAAITRGTTFVKAFIVRANTAVANAAYMLCADYASANNPIGFPLGRVISPVEGPGFIHHIAVTPPAAGVDWTFTPPANSRLKIRHTQARLNTTAVAGNRNVQFVLHDSIGGNDVGTFAAAATIAPSAIAKVSGGPGINPSTLVTLDVTVPLPGELFIGNNSGGSQTLGSLTANLDAGDQWLVIEIFVEEWLDF